MALLLTVSAIVVAIVSFLFFTSIVTRITENGETPPDYPAWSRWAIDAPWAAAGVALFGVVAGVIGARYRSFTWPAVVIATIAVLIPTATVCGVFFAVIRTVYDYQPL